MKPSAHRAIRAGLLLAVAAAMLAATGCQKPPATAPAPVNAAMEAQQADLLRLAEDLSRELRYGNLNPVGTFAQLRDLPDGHCGHYAFLFALRARLKGYEALRIYDLHNDALQADHSLVEVELGGKWWLFDPTTGIRYRHSLVELLEAPAKASDFDSLSHVAETLRVYGGQDFFRGAVVRKQWSMDDPELKAMFAEPEWQEISSLQGLPRELALRANPSMLPRPLVLAETFSPTDSVAVTEGGQPAQVLMPVSLSWLDATRVYIANYSRICVLELRSGQITPVTAPEVPRWMPTGVCYHAGTRRLYVANYQGQDIVVLDATDPLAPTLLTRWTDADMKGPENVSVSPDGQRIAVADYDSNAVLLFDASGKRLWTYPLQMAHGVAFSTDGQHVFASGLGQQAGVHKVDLQGKRVGRIGSCGWGKGGFLWPTSVSVHRNVVAVSDAHTGKITLLSENLVPLSTIGGNGPGVALLNMPYCVLWDQDNSLLLADSFRSRLLRVTPSEGTLRREYTLVPPLDVRAKLRLTGIEGGDLIASLPGKCRLQGPALGASMVYRGDLSTYYDASAPAAWLSLPLLPELPREWIASFSNLLSGDRYLSMASLTPALSASYMYLSWARSYRMDGRLYTVMGSPQARDVLVIRDGIAVSLPLDKDLWCLGDQLVSRYDVISLERAVALGSQRIDIYLARLAKGDHPLDALATLLPGKYRTRDEFTACFVTEAGREFADACMKSSDRAAIHAAARKYVEQVRGQMGLQLGELLLAHAMAAAGGEAKPVGNGSGRVFCDLPRPTRSKLTWSGDRPGLVNVAGEASVVQQSPMYRGFDIHRALDRDTENDYAAAQETPLPQGFTLDLGKPSHVRSVVLTFESSANCASDWSAEAADVQGQPRVLGSVSGGRGQVQELKLDPSQPLRCLRVTVSKTIGQPRLLLRRVEVWVDNTLLSADDPKNPLAEAIPFEVRARLDELVASPATVPATTSAPAAPRRPAMERLLLCLDELSEYSIVPGAGRPAAQVLSTRAGDRLEHAKLMAAFCAVDGHPVRVLQSGEGPAAHAVVEVQVDGRWIMLDPTYGVYFVRREQPAEGLSLAELSKLSPDQVQIKTSPLARAATLLPQADRELVRFETYASREWQPLLKSPAAGAEGAALRK